MYQLAPTLYDLCIIKQQNAFEMVDDVKKMIGKDKEEKPVRKIKAAIEYIETILSNSDFDQAYHPNHHKKLDKAGLKSALTYLKSL